MITETDAVNMALARLNLEPITSLDDKNDRAMAAAPVYKLQLDLFLTEHEWSWAQQIDTPARLHIADTDERTPWKYAYGIPADCVKLNAVMLTERSMLHGHTRPERAGVWHDVARYGKTGEAIWTDAEEIAIRYTSNNITLDEMSPAATEAFTLRLAAELALDIKGNTQLSKLMIEHYQDALAKAKTRDATTHDIQRLQNHAYIDAREI